MSFWRIHDWQHKVDYVKKTLRLCHLFHHRSIVKNPGIEPRYSTAWAVDRLLFTLKHWIIWTSGVINICNDKTIFFSLSLQNFKIMTCLSGVELFNPGQEICLFKGIRFIAMFYKSCHWTLSSGHLFSPLYTGCFHKMHFVLSLHVCQGLPYGHTPCGLQTRILYAFSLPQFCHTSTHHTLFDLVVKPILGEEHKLLISALSTFFLFACYRSCLQLKENWLQDQKPKVEDT